MTIVSSSLTSSPPGPPQFSKKQMATSLQRSSTLASVATQQCWQEGGWLGKEAEAKPTAVTTTLATLRLTSTLSVCFQPRQALVMDLRPQPQAHNSGTGTKLSKPPKTSVPYCLPRAKETSPQLSERESPFCSYLNSNDMF